MKQIKENCEYCNQKMEVKNAKRRFCSDKCRVYFNRKNKPVAKSTETAQISPIIPKPIETTQKKQEAVESFKYTSKEGSMAFVLTYGVNTIAEHQALLNQQK